MSTPPAADSAGAPGPSPAPGSADNPYAAPEADLHDPDVSRAVSAAAATLCHGAGLLALLTFWVPLVGLLLALAALNQGRRVWTPEHRRLVRLGTTYASVALVLMLALLFLAVA